MRAGARPSTGQGLRWGWRAGFAGAEIVSRVSSRVSAACLSGCVKRRAAAEGDSEHYCYRPTSQAAGGDRGGRGEGHPDLRPRLCARAALGRHLLRAFGAQAGAAGGGATTHTARIPTCLVCGAARRWRCRVRSTRRHSIRRKAPRARAVRLCLVGDCFVILRHHARRCSGSSTSWSTPTRCSAAAPNATASSSTGATALRLLQSSDAPSCPQMALHTGT